uniref:Protein kinase domain-containing protein n=2 Tax=Caenorhabditis japonica TaxID=281687 RepID=A0A8R1DMI0_CAEJA
MATPIAPVKINTGDKIKDQFVVKKKLGEGACGQVFLVDLIQGKGKAAMKVEPLMKDKLDEILKMEVYVLKKLQSSRHVCRLLGSGKTDTYTYMVMSLLGKEVADIRRRLPQRKISAPSTVRIFIQLVKALQDMHEAGFVHRDVKPSNMALGLKNEQVVYLFDFGLARQILLADASGKLKLREPRSKSQFRGTVRYCSPNVHQHKEQGRHDDLFGALYAMIETVTSSLPWKGKPKKETCALKEKTSDQDLCKNCPKSFVEIVGTLRKLKYQDTPPYVQFMEKLRADLPKGVKMTDPFEWNTSPQSQLDDNNNDNKSDRENAERGVGADTVNEVDESIITESNGESASSSKNGGGADYAPEDTLDNL